jgi:hypothetical protein
VRRFSPATRHQPHVTLHKIFALFARAGTMPAVY